MKLPLYPLLHLPVNVLGNTSADIPPPEFIGPVYTDDSYVDYYFICRVIYNDSVELTFDVTLLFDGEQIPRVAFHTVSSASSFDVVFLPHDFRGQYDKWVCQRASCM